MPRFPIKTILLGVAVYAVYKRVSQETAEPAPAPAGFGAPAAAPATPAPAPAPVQHTDDALVAEEEAAAAAEAAAIGGRVRHEPEDVDLDADSADPAMQPVYEAGGGPSEGFEGAEADLVDNASHGGGLGDPRRDAPDPEAESDLSGAEYGEPDEEDKEL